MGGVCCLLTVSDDMLRIQKLAAPSALANPMGNASAAADDEETEWGLSGERSELEPMRRQSEQDGGSSAMDGGATGRDPAAHPPPTTTLQTRRLR